MNYAISKTVSLGYDDAVRKVTEELKKEGFGVLTTIYVRETLREKLQVEFSPYVILGACNPPFAHKALLTEELAGLLLPCNIVVCEKPGGTTVAALDPGVMVSLMENPAIRPIAEEVRARLSRVIDRM